MALVRTAMIEGKKQDEDEGATPMTAKPEMTEIEKILFGVDQTWLAKRQEEILEPDLPIIDPHHHLWDRGSRYLFDELLADIGSGHNVLGTVYLQCGSMYRADGDYVMAPLGETEFVNGVG